jgi:hypothetical protein
MTTTAWRVRHAVVVMLGAAALGLGALDAAPALAHGEGLTSYFYVTVPPGVVSAGNPERGVSAQRSASLEAGMPTDKRSR